MPRMHSRIRWAACPRWTIVQPWPCLFGVDRTAFGHSVRCAVCHRKVTDASVWVVTYPSRQAWQRGDAVAADPRTGDPQCRDCAYTWYGLKADELAISPPTARWTCWGAIILHEQIVEVRASAGVPRYGYRLFPQWRSRLWIRPTWHLMSHAEHGRRGRVWPLSAGAATVRNS